MIKVFSMLLQKTAVKERKCHTSELMTIKKKRIAMLENFRNSLNVDEIWFSVHWRRLGGSCNIKFRKLSRTYWEFSITKIVSGKTFQAQIVCIGFRQWRLLNLNRHNDCTDLIVMISDFNGCKAIWCNLAVKLKP